jgi:hypothetical protein
MMMMIDGKQLDVGGGANFSEENTDYPTCSASVNTV